MDWPGWTRAIGWPDALALGFFVLAWAAYEPLIRRLRLRGGVILTDMAEIREAWMGEMTRREMRLIDSQLMGHAINSASFFASANLIVIAAAMGALVGGERALGAVRDLPLLAEAPRALLEAKLALVVLALGRGLLDFIWSIRQMNYCLALFGATPPHESEPAILKVFAQAAADVLNPALSSFSAGVRGYYFALAAGAWLFGPLAFAAATAGAVTLLVWRQSSSPAARATHRIRELIEPTSDRS
jgi:uncharacterized membrane protein